MIRIFYEMNEFLTFVVIKAYLIYTNWPPMCIMAEACVVLS